MPANCRETGTVVPRPREEPEMLLDGVNHIAWVSKDAVRLGRFYERVFDAVVGPTRSHGPGETMTIIDIGPATQLMSS